MRRESQQDPFGCSRSRSDLAIIASAGQVYKYNVRGALGAWSIVLNTLWLLAALNGVDSSPDAAPKILFVSSSTDWAPGSWHKLQTGTNWDKLGNLVPDSYCIPISTSLLGSLTPWLLGLLVLVW